MPVVAYRLRRPVRACTYLLRPLGRPAPVATKVCVRASEGEGSVVLTGMVRYSSTHALRTSPLG